MSSCIRLFPLLAVALLLLAGGGQCCMAAADASAAPAAMAGKTEQAPAAATPANTQGTGNPAAPASTAAAAPAPRFDMNTLIERLKQTKAIGVLTKLVLRSDVNDLIDEVKLYKQTKGTESQLERIKAHFNGLLLKVLALLNDDPKLAQDIQRARDNLWQHLMEVKA
jgi:hypothetical protein